MRPISQRAAGCAVARPPDRTHHRGRTRCRRATTRLARLIAAIVAGGASRRFGGAPKGLLEVGGRRIIDRIANALSKVATEIVIVSNADEAGEWIPGARVVHDVRRERGSLVGIHSAIASAGAPVLVVAWDMPFLTSELLRVIRDRALDAEFAAVPRGPRGPHPLCAAYTTACLPTIEASLDMKDLRVMAMLDRLPSVDYIDGAALLATARAEHVFFNVNDAEDLAVARAMAESSAID
ncbi:MAG TPA: molybdenum cofactor guanylyltransferase [Gemmatimonadaceae bacterium]|nr:molybdenum cofactor guanylyltransferase [Gemmatimonadaceae bacterium]